RYGIPDFQLQKNLLDRRLRILQQEGIVFGQSVHVGLDYPAAALCREFDAVCLAGGSRVPRDLPIEGRDLDGIHFAMDYLIQSNRIQAGYPIPDAERISAQGKSVVVIGGGDTGADCVGTAHRQGASCVMQIEIMPRPARCRTEAFPWPKYPLLLKTSSSHEEGGQREWSVMTRKFSGKNGRVSKLHCVRVEMERDSAGCPLTREVPGSAFEIDADLVILAMGFLHPEKQGAIQSLKLKLDPRGNVKTDAQFMTSCRGVFAAGDMRRGQSLIVWAVAEGRQAAHHIDTYLTGHSSLPVF
ncbi:MAG: FAD-dependent oxidoreductase, partial [Candidatus Omnitrophica bacterium]|nr:FAD-dependent oxidoreductase [Candidatus Omnitrophota bacterium]